MADLLGAGSIASAGAGLLGNIIGGISQRKANQMNLKINQMNNEFNERMMREQMAWQEDMWNKQNAYNTPLAMKQRYREAGLNPGLMFSGAGAAGVAGSVGNASAASAAGNAQMQPFRPDMTSLTQGLQSIDDFYFRKRNQEYINEGLEWDNAFKRASFADRLAELRTNINSGALRNEFQKMLNDTTRLTFDSNIKAIKERNAREELLTESQRTANALQQLVYQNQHHWYTNFGSQSNVMRYLSQCMAIEQMDLTQKETDSRIGKIYEETTGQRITNEILRETKDSTIAATNAIQLFQAGVFDGLDINKYVSARNLENQSTIDFINNYNGAERAMLQKAYDTLRNRGQQIQNARQFVQGLQDAKKLLFGDSYVEGGFSIGPFNVKYHGGT